MIFAELRHFIAEKHGEGAWSELVHLANVPPRTWLPSQSYPDDELTRLIAQAALMAGRPEQELLEEFGEFIVPGLLGLYSALIKPAWRTLDVIEHTEATIHRVVRLRDQRARPPELYCSRTSPSEIQIVYRSARRLCGIAKGIPRGLAAHYGESVAVSETSCMLRGANQCEIWVRLK
jgi:hypothetical protein